MKKMLLLPWFLIIAVSLFTIFAGSGQTTADPLVLTNVFLIDGTGGKPVNDAIVVIENGRILAIGPSNAVTVPPKATRINLKGAAVMPGFINAHVHSGYEEKNLRTWANAGVTTVRDLGVIYGNKYNEDTFRLRDKLSRDNNNARLVAAGPLVTVPRGYGSYYVLSPEDAREKINSLIDDGADIIKIGIEDDLQGKKWEMLSREEITAIVEAAHKRNIPVSAHISRAHHLELAAVAGVDDFAHMIVDPLPAELVSSMKNIYWVPTMELWEGVSRIHGLDWDVTAKNNLSRFVKVGGRVALGTDFSGYIFDSESGMPMTEIFLMKEAGMTPMEIIVAATKHAAFVCNLGDQIGTLEPGKIADILVVNSNPLDDLNALKDVLMVLRNGEIIRWESLP